MVNTFNPSSQVDLFEFKASLVYEANLRPGKAISKEYSQVIKKR